MSKISLVTIFKGVVSLSIMGTLPAIGILILKGIFKDRLSARLQYCIWFLLILRLIIPVTFESPIRFFTYEPISENVRIDNQRQDIPGKGADVQIDTGNGNEYRVSVPLPGLNNISPILTIKYLAFLWLTVMIGIYVYIMIVNTVFAFRLGQCIPCKQPEIYAILNHCKNKLHIVGKVTVLSSRRVKSPMVWGIFRPRIFIPAKIIRGLSQEELKYILLHELAHIKRKDLIIHFITMIIEGIYWFNPVIWYSMHKMKEDCELSCDASVLGTLTEKEYKKYGLTILSIMKKVNDPQPIPGTVGFAVKQNKRRIIMITQYKKTSTKLSVIIMSFIILLTGCSSLSSPETVENSSKNSSQESVEQTAPIADSEGESSASDPQPSSDTEAANSFQPYFDLLGLSKQDLINNISEKPDSIDEGGLEFKEAGIRVWFNWDTNTVSQVYFERNDLDFNGAIIGDKIEDFKSAFGEPISDQNGDMHFKYEDGYISVNYDTQTEITIAVYLLSEDF